MTLRGKLSDASTLIGLIPGNIALSATTFTINVDTPTSSILITIVAVAVVTTFATVTPV